MRSRAEGKNQQAASRGQPAGRDNGQWAAIPPQASVSQRFRESKNFVISTQKRRSKKTELYVVVSLFLLIIFGLGFYGVFIEPYQVEIRHVWIGDSNLAKILKEKTIVHLSDLHIGKIGEREQKVLHILDELQPDLIFLTGDYVSWRGDVEPALEFLSRMKAQIGVWAVMGDYDYSEYRKSCLFCHEQGSGKRTKSHQVQFLRNSIRAVSLPTGTVWIGGMDHNGERIFIPEKLPQGWNRKEPAIILSHNPLSFDQLDETHNALILSGDTHGGQVPPSFLAVGDTGL